MEKRWEITATNQETVEHLQQELSVDRIVATLLMQRGIKDFESSRLFFRPELGQLHDPFLMKNMEKAIHRINSAIAINEKVLVYGDYDVDGTTAVSIVYSFFKNYIQEIEFYIPDRYREGYGISYAGIDYAAENQFSLIIALDCGIKAIDKIEYANKKNIDFIICDHHLPGEIVPNAFAVLDPKQNDCNYPYKELSGAGIGFKLIEAFSIKNILPPEICYSYLDLAVTSIAADIVPITGENRVMAYHGLKILNTKPRPGIAALLNLYQTKSEVNISSLVFVLGPRINAAGRIEHASKSVELLICEDDEIANELAMRINDTNSQRKDLDLGTTNEAIEYLEGEELSGKSSIVLFNKSWHKGVIGIVASRLIEKYYRPTIILTESDGKATGSARSVKEYDIYSAIEKCSDLLDQFGGHKFAAGLTLKPENVNAFREKFEQIVSSTITPQQLIPKIDIDIEIDLSEITEKLVRILRQFAPHGPENMTPIFCARNVFDTGWGRVVGSNHLKLELFQKSNPNFRFQAIAYDKGDFVNFFQRKTPMDIAFKIQENEFRGTKSIQLVIEDVRISET
ncbi:MAG: single-stranded-DNA-specific exonuclease RecJ [Sphingobacteriaceae bacterium]|nr:single-stranded-DNA-specific exonuclease RecJ [Sphingobacteriaceae bacterium]